MANFSDFNMGIYLAGLSGQVPPFPLTYAGLEEAAKTKLDPKLYDYVAGGSGDEATQHANVDAFAGWGITPRMLSGAAERDLSIKESGYRLDRI